MPTPPSSTTNSNSDSASNSNSPSSISPSPSPPFPPPYSLQIYTDSSSTRESKLPPSRSVLNNSLNVGSCALLIVACITHSWQLGGVKSGTEEKWMDSNPCFAKYQLIWPSWTFLNVTHPVCNTLMTMPISQTCCKVRRISYENLAGLPYDIDQ